MQKPTPRHTQGKKIIAIVGPTASGKSSLGIWLAQHLRVGAGLAKKVGGEVISADSRQIYKGLNIGTGKVTARDMKGVPHHLLSVASPKRTFTAADFITHAQKAHSDILKNKRIPIVVGGTGFYVDAFLGRVALPSVAPNPRLRKRLEKESVEVLYKLLKKKDPARARTVEPKHKRRIIRALEIAQAVGRSPALTRVSAGQSPYDVLWLGLNPSPGKLAANIHKRLHARMRAGMVAEAKRLHTQGLSYKRMEELGLEYRFLARYLQKKISRNELEEQLEREIKKYAKRQLCWFKRNKNIRWVKNNTEALLLAKAFLK